ncbi:MAG TPA: phytoene desaturase family protein, partial [Flavobacteriales bacterium]|nr:phytoene desaturase family protein [Flavobacteriales bacterium]
MSRTAIVIGAGFAGLSVAAHLAKAGRRVTLLEKNATPGGRAGTLRQDGFTFDTGPSWYWMPDVFERHFAFFGRKPEDYFDLVRLDPSYAIYFGEGDRLDVPASMEGLRQLFESLEPGSAAGLDRFLTQARAKYDLGMNHMVRKPGSSIMEFADAGLLKGILHMQVFTSFSKHVRRFFKHPKLIGLLEFPVLFLGATPQDTPALFSLMNHADMALGTWYPMGGMGKVVDGMVAVARELGVEIRLNEEVTSIEVDNRMAHHVTTKLNSYQCDQLVGGADYHHVEQRLLPPELRVHSARYWERRTMAPSVLMFFIGVDRRLNGLRH